MITPSTPMRRFRLTESLVMLATVAVKEHLGMLSFRMVWFKPLVGRLLHFTENGYNAKSVHLTLGYPSIDEPETR